ncbi:hypothetical protein GYMLUDRAFT_243627 [Collybiopsis luxurians FD-317 M1]|uniref:Methyltransferase domain-containing protein n=1 Tax=Collybiopsis luxurians FD-317 M1 TaxID=944289 RepID=A0A0D0BZT9_9AGAR|nr:hypothetical protein GYMLUDRAFT_243627 [Collybiopsis luxurians FD-317 M1]
MDELTPGRYYASEQYLLPADEAETARLGLQHRVFSKSFENRISLAPLNLQSGGRVLESAAGTGIWALEFFKESSKNGIVLDMECIDISDKQFPQKFPPNVHFSVRSVIDLPAEWNSNFSYVHQRLLVLALDDSLWRKVISEFFRVLLPGGWLELVEIDTSCYRDYVGPCTNSLQSLALSMFAEKGIIVDMANYFPPLLEETGFVDVRCEVRRVRIGQSGENGYRSDEIGNFFRGLKRDVVNGGGYGIVRTEEDYEELLKGCELEWNIHSDEAYVYHYAFLARKP